MINIIIFSIAIFLFFIDILHEFNIIRDIKSTFTCSYCGSNISEYTYKCKCETCNRKIKLENKSWEHFLLRRVNWLSTNNKDIKLYCKDYLILPKREITICIICICILILGIITSL